MVNSNTKGDRGERELVNWLSENGWAPIRVPSSGSATGRDLPDVIAGNGTQYVALEVKRSTDAPIYIDGEELDALVRFGDAFGAEQYVAAKWDLSHGDDAYGTGRPGFYCAAPGLLHRTEGGNYRIKKDTAHRHAIPEVDL